MILLSIPLYADQQVIQENQDYLRLSIYIHIKLTFKYGMEISTMKFTESEGKNCVRSKTGDGFCDIRITGCKREDGMQKTRLFRNKRYTTEYKCHL